MLHTFKTKPQTEHDFQTILQVGIAFEKLEEGFENAMKDYNKKQVNQLNALINHLLGDLHPLDRFMDSFCLHVQEHSYDQA